MKYISWLAATALILFIASNAFCGEYYQYTDEEGNLRFTDDYETIPQKNKTGIKTYQSVVSKPQPTTGEPTDDSEIEEPSDTSPETSEDIQPSGNEGPGESDMETQVDSGESGDQSDMTEPSTEEYQAPEEEPSVEPGSDNSMEETPVDESSPSDKLTDTIKSSEDYQTMTKQFDRERDNLEREATRLQKEKQALDSQDVKDMTKMELNAYEEKVKDLNSRIKRQEKEQSQFQERVNNFNQRIIQKQAPDEGVQSGDNS
jgi:hypothetical protein